MHGTPHKLIRKQRSIINRNNINHYNTHEHVYECLAYAIIILSLYIQTVHFAQRILTRHNNNNNNNNDFHDASVCLA